MFSPGVSKLPAIGSWPAVQYCPCVSSFTEGLKFKQKMVDYPYSICGTITYMSMSCQPAYYYSLKGLQISKTADDLCLPLVWIALPLCLPVVWIAPFSTMTASQQRRYFLSNISLSSPGLGPKCVIFLAIRPYHQDLMKNQEQWSSFFVGSLEHY